jgi:hypothetical protein
MITFLVITSDNKNGTLWDSINLALSVALLVVALAALHTSKNWTQHKQRSTTLIHNAKREKNSCTPPTTVSKPSGLETQQPPATYASSPSYQETRLKQITLTQETQPAHSYQPTEGATKAEETPHYQTHPLHKQ